MPRDDRDRFRGALYHATSQASVDRAHRGTGCVRVFGCSDYPVMEKQFVPTPVGVRDLHSRVCALAPPAGRRLLLDHCRVWNDRGSPVRALWRLALRQPLFPWHSRVVPCGVWNSGANRGKARPNTKRDMGSSVDFKWSYQMNTIVPRRNNQF